MAEKLPPSWLLYLGWTILGLTTGWLLYVYFGCVEGHYPCPRVL